MPDPPSRAEPKRETTDRTWIGALSKYADQAEPLDWAEVRERVHAAWGRERGEHFDRINEEYLVRTTLDLDEDLYRQLKAAAALKGETVRTMVTRAIQRELTQPTPSPTVVREATPKPWFGSLHKYAKNVENHDWDAIREAVDAARARGER